MKYKEFSKLDLAAIGEEILQKWERTSAFQKSIDLRAGQRSFVFYEGPPSANGLPGIHHVISRTLKDIICRYKTMQKYLVQRKGGWDTHGLPVELAVEKLLGITKEDIGKTISVEEYNNKCREVVMQYKDQWDSVTRKMGYWVDLQNPFVTFESNYIETVWWCLKELYKKGLLYEDVSIQPYSPAAGTGLSSHELNQPGTYKDVKDTSVVAMFRAVRSNESEFLYQAVNTNELFFLAWTTTPWTLPSNLGLTVGAAIDYNLVKTFNPYSGKPCAVILAKNLLHKYFPEHPDEWMDNNNTLYEAITAWLDNGIDDSTIFDSESEPGEATVKSEFDNLIKKKQLPFKTVLQFKGSQIAGCKYEQLFSFEANALQEIELLTPGARPFKVITGDFVTTEDGTGIVHTAPAFGADDFKAGKKNNLGILTLVDKEGKFIAGVGKFSGRYVKDYKEQPGYIDVNVDICVHLKHQNQAFKIEKYEHNYPHCWRTDKPIIYYPLDAWFIKTTAAKDRMIELNKTINWKPASTGTGRFGNWLENMVDWNLSRSRFWGTPLPVWRTEDGEEEKCIGSLAELTAEIQRSRQVLGEDVNKEYLHDQRIDLHKPYVDNIVLASETGKPMTRVPDLIDVWFDSGAMPYAQWGLPDTSADQFGPLSTENFWKYHAIAKMSQLAETKKWPEPEKQNVYPVAFPADFIAEGVDQTRGWFYTLHVLGVLLFDSVAYKTVISNGFVLDKNGNKMSKRLGNVVDPFATLDNFGPDATRWYLITNAAPWDSLKFDSEGIKEVQRKFFGTIYNIYQFFALYANVDQFAYTEKAIPPDQRPEMDRWILSELNSLQATVEVSMDEYEPTLAARAIEKFTDEQLSNWYVRLCRRRFWKGEYEFDKICAYQTLYECLEVLSKLLAPFAPFFGDWLFCNLNEVTNRLPVESVHHSDFPGAASQLTNVSLEKRMQLAQDISSLILSLRKKVNIKVRQPLQKVLIPAVDDEFKDDIKSVEDIIKAETNIKDIEILSGTDNFIRKKAKANYKTLGKKLGAKMKWGAEKIQNLTNTEIEAVQKGDFLLNSNFILEKEVPVFITAEDIEVTTDKITGFEVASKGALTVALDITVNEVLKMEGEAREFVNKIQHVRKDHNLEVTDRIFVKVSVNANLKASFTQYYDYICAEILAEKLEFVSEIPDGTSIEVNEITLIVNVTKKGPYGKDKNQ